MAEFSNHLLQKEKATNISVGAFINAGNDLLSVSLRSRVGMTRLLVAAYYPFLTKI
jgi:hypothetical protein